MSGPAVIATSPASAPFSPANRSMRPSIGLETNSAAITPAAAARFVLTSTCPIVTTAFAVPSSSTEPPLNPNHPSHRMNTPRVTTRIFDGGVGLALPSLRNLPSLGPSTITPASAAHPPVEWTMVDPAKSWNPISLSQPPPHVHAPTTGYITAVSTSTKMKNDHILTRSATAPDTIDAVAATNTIWKNQSDIVE